MRLRTSSSLLLPIFLLAAGLSAREARADAKACVAAHEAGITSKEAQKPLAARDSFIACTSADCPPAVRDECVNMLREVERQVATVVVSAKSREGVDLVNVELYVDGKLVQQALSGNAIELDPGQHEFKIVHPSAGQLVQRALIVEGEKRRRILLEFPKPPRSKPSESAPAPERGLQIPLASYFLGGVGVLALGSFSYFAISGRSKQEDLDACAPRCAPDDVDVMRQRYLIADISLGVGVLALGGAVGFAVLSSGSQPRDSGVALRATPSSLALSGRF